MFSLLRSSVVKSSPSSLRTFHSARCLLNQQQPPASAASSPEPKEPTSSSSSNKTLTTDEKISHLNFLKNYYSEELVESIKLAETFIDPEHYANRKLRTTEFAPPYLDDFSKKDKFWDTLEIKDTTEYDFRLPLQPSPIDIPAGSSLAETKGSALKNSIAKDLASLTGLDEQYIDRLTAKPLIMKRVSNQTAKGKIPTNYALVVVGDKRGMIGIGEGKDRVEMSRAVSKAHWNAVKNLQYIPRYEDRTIIGNIDNVFHGCKIFLRSAPPGFGLRVNHYLFEICELVGIKDLSAKIYKSRNPMNVCKGFIEALAKQQTLEELSNNRGKKVVDIRKTYYSA